MSYRVSESGRVALMRAIEDSLGEAADTDLVQVLRVVRSASLQASVVGPVDPVDHARIWEARASVAPAGLPLKRRVTRYATALGRLDSEDTDGLLAYGFGTGHEEARVVTDSESRRILAWLYHDKRLS